MAQDKNTIRLPGGSEGNFSGKIGAMTLGIKA